MACGLEEALAGKSLQRCLIDPWGGAKDLGARRVRAVDPRAFDEDPLRVLRAFSSCALFYFSMEPRTRRLVEAKKGGLKRVSAERVRDELFKILSSSRAGGTFALLDRSGLVDILFPELEPMKRMRQGAYHHLDVWGHTLETLAALEGSLGRLRSPAPRAYLAQELSSGRDRRELLKLAALLHDIGKPKTYRRARGKVTFYGHDREGAYITQAIAERLKLSREEQRSLRRVVFMHLRPGFMATVPVLSARAEFRFFRDAGVEAPAILLLSAADLKATKGYALADRTRARHERLIRRLLKTYFQRREEPVMKRLVTGDDLIGRLKMEPSPLMGKVLRELEELQAEGAITTKAKALARARELIKAEA
jgi:poly(A) polymerase